MDFNDLKSSISKQKATNKLNNIIKNINEEHYYLNQIMEYPNRVRHINKKGNYNESKEELIQNKISSLKENLNKIKKIIFDNNIELSTPNVIKDEEFNENKYNRDNMLFENFETTYFLKSANVLKGFFKIDGIFDIIMEYRLGTYQKLFLSMLKDLRNNKYRTFIITMNNRNFPIIINKLDDIKAYILQMPKNYYRSRISTPNRIETFKKINESLPNNLDYLLKYINKNEIYSKNISIGINLKICKLKNNNGQIIIINNKKQKNSFLICSK